MKIFILLLVLTTVVIHGQTTSVHDWEKKQNMLTKRSDLSAQTIGNLIYLTGGCTSNQPIAKDATCPSITNSMEIYNPQTNSFTFGKAMPRPRYRHTTVAIQNRYLFVIGGRDLNENIITQVDVFDTVNGNWTIHNATLTSDCCSDSIAFVLKDSNGNENIYLPGGYYANYTTSGKVLQLTTKNGVYSGTFQSGLVSDMNVKRGDSMTLTYNNKAYVIGGFLEDNFCKPITTVEVYDSSTNKWTITSPLSHERADGAAIMVGSALFVLGGESKDKSCNVSLPVSDVEKFDTASGKWSDFVALPTARFRQTGEIVNNVMYVFGGQIEIEIAQQYSVLDWTYAYNFTDFVKISAANSQIISWIFVFSLLFILVV
ncbi:hypothetical protein NAEGRDRAFT_70995 [Naegleria gruberi]|uniref:Attractin/MKLN-like beta-propeller domain-containing protein n=1 Tax=Naegleria gruberi TaxID=5762 RepID=D2VPV0_NAEGR|nr:uncharacterized protein NAEGRDRAFT_70995 [Naegleria gruberi]EFC41189.1 hypothetical protein NAEGRDRAFT_70995 [Naegleria gruberi]|eukprot:XP_002673933.1 hypothetical protein NAEGRDRAFT_70995 [Naegleria gruberi strain NEG-M]